MSVLQPGSFQPRAPQMMPVRGAEAAAGWSTVPQKSGFDLSNSTNSKMQPKSPCRKLQARAKALGHPANRSAAELRVLLGDEDPADTDAIEVQGTKGHPALRRREVGRPLSFLGADPSLVATPGSTLPPPWLHPTSTNPATIQPQPAHQTRMQPASATA